MQTNPATSARYRIIPTDLVVPAAILPLVREQWSGRTVHGARAALRLAAALAPTIPACAIMALLGEGADWIARTEDGAIIIERAED